MGAAQGTPANCLLCDVLTPNPVTLRCNHQFCQRCIGDLWSVTPSGPYHCPESRCRVVYQTLPFDRSFIRPPPTPNRQSPSRSTAVSSGGRSSSHNEESSSASDLRRPSLTSRLLGKRKAGTPVSEEHAAKRTAVESPNERSRTTEAPTTSLSDRSGETAAAGASTTAVNPESTLSASGDGKSPTKNSVGKVAGNDGPQDVPEKQKQLRLESADDSDSSSEVDLCDAPLTAMPKIDAGATGTYISPKKRASTASSDSRPTSSGPDRKSVV